MIRKFSTTLFAAAISFALMAEVHAASTVDPTQPPARGQLNSAPIRANFQSAFNDLNNIESMFLGTTAPTNPSNLQTWANSSGFPVIVLNLFNAQTGQWVPYAKLNVTTGVYQTLAGASVNVVAPIANNPVGGLPVLSLNYSSSFSVSGNALTLNPPGSSTLGGVESLTCGSHQWLSQISTAGVPICSQPGFGDISGTAAAAQGGTGAVSPTAHAVAIAEGATPFDFIATGTAGRILLDQGTGIDPAFELMSGDATLAASGALTLATVNANTGSFGNGTQVPQVTFDAKGHATSVSNVIITHGSLDLQIAQNLADLANPESARTNLGLGAFATATTATSPLSLSGNTLSIALGTDMSPGALQCDGTTTICTGGVVEAVGTGNVSGPSSSTAEDFAAYADGTGKLLNDSGVALNVILQACDTSGGMGMDPTGTTPVDAAINAWNSRLAISPTHTGCIIWGPGNFTFASEPVITMPNGLWSSSSTTSNTIGTGTKTFTVPSCTNIPTAAPNNTATAYHQTLTANSLMVGTVSSCSGTTLTLTITSTSGSGTFASWGIVQDFLGGDRTAGVSWFGQGKDTTVLKMAGGIGGPIFSFAGIAQNLTLDNFSITTDMAGGQPGPCLTLTNSYPFLGAVNPQLEVDRITCRGDDGYGIVDYWADGFVNNYVSNVNYEGPQYFGDDTGGTHGTAMVFNNPGSNGCVPASSSPWQCGENYTIHHPYLDNAQVSIFIAANTQFVTVDGGGQFLNCQNGIEVASGSGVLQGLYVIGGNTFFCTQQQINDKNGVKDEIVTNNFFAMTASAYAVQFNNNFALTVSGNHFTPFTPGTVQGAINIAGPSQDLSMITDNIATGGATITTCINLSVGSTGVRVANNSCASGGIVNSGSGNFVGASFAGAPTSGFVSSQGSVTHQ